MVDRPLVAMPYNSDSMDQTIHEIQNWQVNPRSLIKMQLIKKRRDFGQPYKLNDTDAGEKMLEIKQVSDALFHMKKKVIDIDLQGCNNLVSTQAQTTWYRKMNKAIQAEHQS